MRLCCKGYGVLQALSKLQGQTWTRIESVDYLSSVSGGGYAAVGWLSSMLFAMKLRKPWPPDGAPLQSEVGLSSDKQLADAQREELCRESEQQGKNTYSQSVEQGYTWAKTKQPDHTVGFLGCALLTSLGSIACQTGLHGLGTCMFTTQVSISTVVVHHVCLQSFPDSDLLVTVIPHPEDSWHQ